MHTPRLWEMFALVLILAASLGGFAWRFRRVLRIILASKPDADFRLAPLAPRLWEFLRDVALQAKVIRHRPLPGLAHALVFWGFCAFALVTLNHIAQGFGLELLNRHSPFGRFYFGLAALFALAVSVSITGLALRRFLVRPRWLGEVKLESGFIALLILVLMVTYLLDYYPLGAGANGPGIWWLHTLALAIFLPLIPHTKHLHLVLSPATVFLSRGGFSKIPPLADDDDFGLDTGKDVTQLAALQAFSCVECGRCTEHCPAATTGKLLNPKEIVLGLRGYLNENGARAEAPLLGVHLQQEAVFQCTTCGACEYQCPVGIEHLPVIVGLRRGAVNTGKWEDNYGTKLFLNLERNGNPLGLPASQRDQFIAKAGLPHYDGSQEYLLWLGCMGSYDPQGRQIVESLARVLRHLGVSFGVLKKERCTGDSARRLGNDLLFGELAQQNLSGMQQAGVKKVLSICPHCVRTMKEDWRETDAEAAAALEVEHHSQFLARHAAQLPPATASQSVVLHDPCYLGRYQGIYDAPRAAASLAGNLLEADRSRETSFCCGAGGGLAFLGEERGKRVSVERAEQLAATGATLVAAACPFCNTMFRDALATGAVANPPQLLDIAQIAAARLGEP
ncbi:MAG: (Fe-S)-binding protein [Acidobacteria bacterium]|nr:(Fe-S)-binding protein [Acidobacteriota bacterium]